MCSLESSLKGKVRSAGTCVLTSGRAMHRATPAITTQHPGGDRLGWASDPQPVLSQSPGSREGCREDGGDARAPAGSRDPPFCLNPGEWG